MVEDLIRLSLVGEIVGLVRSSGVWGVSYEDSRVVDGEHDDWGVVEGVGWIEVRD